jgi:hypothetical protein
MGNTKAILLAGPERRRILRELLNTPDPLSWRQRERYREMIGIEYWAIQRANLDALRSGNFEELRDPDERKRQYFEIHINNGVPVLDAMRAAERDAAKPAPKWPSRGEIERRRRTRRKQAVTALDGAEAVTTGIVWDCIVCGKQLVPRRFTPSSGRMRRRRRDQAYCSDACRQKAFRHRKDSAIYENLRDKREKVALD